MEAPPVPSPRVKSPPWIMKRLMTRWNTEPLYVKGLSGVDLMGRRVVLGVLGTVIYNGFNYFSPVHRALKFSTVFGTTWM